MARSLKGLARDLEKWGDGMDSPPREWEYREFLAARAIAMSLAIDSRRMVKQVTGHSKAGARAVSNSAQRRKWAGLRRSAWVVKATGPVHWWEWGTDDHWVVASGADMSNQAVRRRRRIAKGTYRGKLKDAQVLSPGKGREYGVYAFVRGMRATPFWYRTLDRYWPDAVDRAAPQLERAIGRTVL